MKNRKVLYHEAYILPLNIYLIFYIYVLAVLVVANLLPVSTISYFIFLFFGLSGIYFLFAKATYKILIAENTLEVSLKVVYKLTLLRLNIKDIQGVEEIAIDSSSHSFQIKKKAKLNYTAYLIKKPNGVKITMLDKRIYVISCNDSKKIRHVINPGK